MASSRHIQSRPANDPHRDVARVVISRERLRRRVRELAREIARRYAGEELAVVGALCGAMVFLADLVRQIPLPLTLHVVGLRSYAGGSTRPGELDLYLPLSADLRGKHVLIVDDILDGGQTLRAMTEMAAALGPASVRSCVLLSRKRPRDLSQPESACPRSSRRRLRGRVPDGHRDGTRGQAQRAPDGDARDTGGAARPDFIGFEIGPEFVVGYGLDFGGRYRNLPEVCVLKRHARPRGARR
jgi:hypoxanthine phosphoribosyltransferase